MLELPKPASLNPSAYRGTRRVLRVQARGQSSQGTAPLSMCLLHNNDLFKCASAARAIRRCSINKGDFMQTRAEPVISLKAGAQ